ncbi:MtrAB system histidine kinase MtrB [Nocardia jiangxiensis]|uniref:Sensor histidine kinase MtrB n=1 Tax=Nocardia jiangxiensis TaxID=282685 RepID=A0ABW6SF47_9NOCA
MAWFKSVGESLGHVWRRSLQLRVVVSTLTLSLIVITILGVVLTSQITDRLLDGKIAAAVEEMGRARATVENQLAGAHDSGSQLTSLQAARNALSSGNSGQSGGTAGNFNSALEMVGENMQDISVGPVQEVPAELRRFVQQNQVSYQFATVSDPDGYRGRALVIGSPSTQVPTLEVYLIFPLTNEDRSLGLMRGTMFIGGAVLLVLLAAITALVTRQVVLPIRSAARIAGRFADGRLRERMLVRGEDDMAKLAISFNAMAESLSNQITQLEEFGNLQRRFTSDVSHELRTPLTTVRMAADLIHGSSDELDSALARSAELLVTELDRFEGLLNDLLEISRHDAGVAELQVESLDVRMCARAAISTVRHLAKESNVELVVDLPEEPLVAEVDPRRVERVLRNLLANAIDHSEGKPVLIRMRGDVDANAVAIVVRDQGVGLRPGEEKLVFNRFWRSDPSRMRRSGGTGLGLSISVEDANLHDGKLEAWGELGAGASFRLTLPLVRGRKLGPSPLSLEPPRRRGAPRELLAAPSDAAQDVPQSETTAESVAEGSDGLSDTGGRTDPAEVIEADSFAAGVDAPVTEAELSAAEAEMAETEPSVSEEESSSALASADVSEAERDSLAAGTDVPAGGANSAADETDVTGPSASAAEADEPDSTASGSEAAADSSDDESNAVGAGKNSDERSSQGAGESSGAGEETVLSDTGDGTK